MNSPESNHKKPQNWKPVDDLRLSQATWSKSENLLRNSSQVLASAEHYLSATGAILQDLEGEGIAEIKSLLLQLDKARTRLLSMRCFRRIGILFATNNLSLFAEKVGVG
jgi:hypothetical protein